MRKLLAILVLWGIFACSERDETSNVCEYIQISAGIRSRVAENVFEENDQITVCSYETNDSALKVVSNSVNTLTPKGLWEANPIMKWKDKNTLHDFVAISPAREVTSYTAQTVTLSDDLKTNDILLATAVSRNSVGGPVPLTFVHAMSKITVIISYADEFDYQPGIGSVSLHGQHTAIINFIQKKAVGTGSASYLPFIQQQPASLSYEVITTPQTIAAGTPLIKIQLNDISDPYIYTQRTDLILNQSEIRTLHLTVGRTKIELKSMTIQDWTYNQDIGGGEAEVEP